MKKIFLYCSIAALSLIGCKKDNNTTGNANPNLIQTMSNSSGTTATFSYNDQGLIRQIQGFGGGAQTFEWTSTSLVRTIENSPITYPRNSAGYVASDMDGSTYSYNSQNNLVSVSNGIGTASYTWSDGNIVSITKMPSNETITMEYYTDKTDNRDVGLKYFPWFGQLIFSGDIPTMGNKNLLKKIISPNGIWEFTWQFDSKGRVSKRIDGNGNSETYTYVN